jgi:hypothetical protein
MDFLSLESFLKRRSPLASCANDLNISFTGDGHEQHYGYPCFRSLLNNFRSVILKM